MSWSERWERMNPEHVLMRKQERSQRSFENSNEGKSMIAAEKLESMFRQYVPSEPLFSSAHAAIVFALNYNHQQYDKPLMNRLSWGPMPEGKG